MSHEDEIQRAYAVTFGSPAGQMVLADLTTFCHVIDPLVHEDAKDRSDRRLLMNEGRREVALRILTASKMTIDDLFNLRLGRRMALRTTEGEPIDG